jgi:hypothetical protein
MGVTSDVERAAAAEATGAEEERARAFVWDWRSFARCVRAFAATTLVVFVLGVTIGAIAPWLPSRVLGVLAAINLWPTAYLSHLVPIFLFILLSNIKSALIAALLGSAGAWANSRANVGRRAHGSGRVRPASVIDRMTLALAGAVMRGGRCVFRGIGDESQDLAARSSAALAALVPFVALAMNGIVLGLWMAEALLKGWVGGLVAMGRLLLPHAPVELPALVLASAIGVRLAERLVPRRPGHDAAWQCGEVRRLVTSDRVAQSLGLIVGLLAIAAALELYGLVR